MLKLIMNSEKNQKNYNISMRKNTVQIYFYAPYINIKVILLLQKSMFAIRKLQG